MRRLLALLLAGCLALPAPAWAAVSFISSTGQTGNPAAGPLSLTIPTVVTDDYLVMSVVHRSDSGEPVVTDNDSGGNTWTTLATGTSAADPIVSGSVYWKRATGSTSAKTITATAAGTPDCMAADLLVYRGVSTSDPAHEALSARNDTVGSHPAITTLTDGAHLMLALMNAGVSGTGSWLAGATAFVSGGQINSTGGSDCQTTFVSVPWPTAGTSGTMTWTGASSSTHWAFAIKPAGAAAACVPKMMLLGVGGC